MRASIALRGDHAELARLQDFADAFARDHGLPDGERSRLLIILEELFTNAVTHGHRSDAVEGNVVVALTAKAGRLRISFVDDGPPFDPLTFPEPELDGPAKSRAVGGLGIHIVRSLVHQARYHRKGGRNRLHLVRRIGSHR